jgi:ketosteroid isomerase-like protein
MGTQVRQVEIRTDPIKDRPGDRPVSGNKAVIEEYVAAFNAGDFGRLRNLFAPDAVIYGALGWGSLDEVLPGWYDLHHGLSLKLEVEDMIAEGDLVAVRYRESGAFVGPYHGQMPNERSYELVAIEWFEVKDGRIRRRWGARDSASQARQLGMQ